MSQRECEHGFLEGWCSVCRPQVNQRTWALLLLAVMWLCLALSVLVAPGCAALGSPAGQQATKTALSIAAGLIEREFAERDMEPDRAETVCFPPVDDDAPAGLMCWIPEAQ